MAYARQCVGLSRSVRFNFKLPRASRVPHLGFQKTNDFLISKRWRIRILQIQYTFQIVLVNSAIYIQGLRILLKVNFYCGGAEFPI